MMKPHGRHIAIEGAADKATSFAGVWPAMVTPVDEQGRPALETIDQLVELFIEQHVGGLYILGSTGQGLLFSRDERQLVAERVVRANRGRLPVIVHVGAMTTEESVRLAQHAQQIGADAVASIGPVYYRVDADGVFEHYRRIGLAGKLPFFIYHIDLVNQPNLTPAQFVARALEVPNIRGIKITTVDLLEFGQIHHYCEGRLALFMGRDVLLCHAALSGAVGAIGFFFNLWGRECQVAREAFLAGQVEAATRFIFTFREVSQAVHAGGLWQYLRAGMHRRFGIDIGLPRAPLATIEKQVDEAELVRMLDAMELASREIELAIQSTNSERRSQKSASHLAPHHAFHV